MSRDQVKLSTGITNFDSAHIKFLSNKDDKDSLNIETIIHEWIDHKKDKQILDKETIKKKSLPVKENFLKRNEREKDHRLQIIKNLNFEDRIKDDLIKDIINDVNQIDNPMLNQIQIKKSKIKKKIKIVVYVSCFYSFYLFADVYDQRNNKYNNIQDMINNKPRALNIRYKQHFFIYSFLITLMGYFIKKNYKIENDFNKFVRDNYIHLSDEELSRYKLHGKF